MYQADLPRRQVHVVGGEAPVQIVAGELDRPERRRERRRRARDLGEHGRRQRPALRRHGGAGRSDARHRGRAERLLAPQAMLEVHRRAMRARRDRAAGRIADGHALAVEVGRGHEAVEVGALRHRELVGAPRRHRRHGLERVLELVLHVLALEQRAQLGARRIGEQRLDAGAVAPEIDHGAELAVAADRVGEEQAVEPARRRARDHVDDRVDVGEALEDAPDAAAAHEIEVLARDAVHVDRERDAAVHHQAEPQLAFGRHVRAARGCLWRRIGHGRTGTVSARRGVGQR